MSKKSAAFKSDETLDFHNRQIGKLTLYSNKPINVKFLTNSYIPQLKLLSVNDARIVNNLKLTFSHLHLVMSTPTPVPMAYIVLNYTVIPVTITSIGIQRWTL